MEKRYDYIDLLKCIAIFMAISLHTGLWTTNFVESSNMSVLIQYCIRILCEGVPIFILVNGFLILHKPLNFEKHIKKILKILLILLFWSILSVVVIMIFNKTDKLSFNNVINQVLDTNVTNYYNGHLWFLISLIVLYLIFPVIKTIYDNNKKIYNFVFIVALLFTFVPNFLVLLNDIFRSDLLIKIYNFINKFNPFRENIFIIYFMMGGYLYEKKDCFKKNSNNKIIVIVSIISYIFMILLSILLFKYRDVQFKSNYFYGNVLLLLTIIGIVILTSLYKPKKNSIIKKIVNSIGKNTLGIYLIHFMIVKVSIKYFKIGGANFKIRLLYTFIIIMFSYFITWGIKKIPVLRKSVEL